MALNPISPALLALILAIGLPSPAANSASTRPAPLDRSRMEQLDKRAADLIKAGKLDAAEPLLQQALAIAPRYYRSLYNMARIQARRSRIDDAMDYLERAAEEGFTDFIQIQANSDFAPLRALDRYKALIARKDEIQKTDADRTLLILQNQFGAGYLYEVDAPHKLILALNTDRPTLDATKRLLGMQSASLDNDLFANRPDQYIMVILPTPAKFAAMSRPGVGGGYDHNTHILIVGRLGQLLTHEFTHALHNADLDGSGQEHPTWLSEGLATMYESGHFTGQRLLPADNYRLADIQREAREGGLVPLSRLLEFDQAAFNRTATKAYGQSASLLLYLHVQGLLRKFYDTYKSLYPKDKTGRLALETVTGLKLPDLERQWINWMLPRTPPMEADGPVLGVRYGASHDGLPIASVDRNTAAARAGLKSGDVIVGLDETDVRDAYTLVPLLRAHRYGDQVVLKIRRDGAYRDVPVTLPAR